MLTKRLQENWSSSDTDGNLVLYSLIKFTSWCNLSKNSELYNTIQKLKLAKFEPLTLNLQAVISNNIILGKYLVQE